MIEFSESDRPSLRYIAKQTCKRFGCKEKHQMAKLYNKSGIQLFENDVDFIKAGDILYIALEGKWAALFRALMRLSMCGRLLCRGTV